MLLLLFKKKIKQASYLHSKIERELLFNSFEGEYLSSSISDWLKQSCQVFLINNKTMADRIEIFKGFFWTLSGFYWH